MFRARRRLSAAKAVDLLPSVRPEIVIVDLSAPGVDIAQLMQTIAAGSSSSGPSSDATAASLVAPKVVAFAPHVHEQKLAAAQSAGCDAVLTRGQFDRSIADILSGRIFA